jgi:hypothetical protein
VWYLIADVHIHSTMKMEQAKCSETSAIKHHTPGNNPKDYTKHSVKLINPYPANV